MAKLNMLKPKVNKLSDNRTSSIAAERVRGRAGQRARERILIRDDYLCVHCKQRDVTSLATQVDHIVPLAFGGSDSDANKQSLCDACHQSKSTEEERARLEGRGGVNP